MLLAIVPLPPTELLRRHLHRYTALRRVEVDLIGSPSRPADHQARDSVARELHTAVQDPEPRVLASDPGKVLPTG